MFRDSSVPVTYGPPCAMSRKVLFVAPSAYPLGGVAVWLDYLCRGLPRTGWKSVAGLVSGAFHDVAAYQKAYPGLPAEMIRNPTGSREGRIRALIDVIRRVRPDIVVSVNIRDTYAAVQRLRLDGDPVRAVMALHAIEAPLLHDLRAERKTIDAVITTNQLARRLCHVDAQIDEDRVLYAPYGVDVADLGAVARSPRATVLRIVWVGRFDEFQKRVSDLVGILTHLDALTIDYCLTLVGDGPERASMSASLAAWTKSGRVVFAGALRSTDLGPSVYANADVLLLTSSWETGPIVIWEAMAAGVAVVTSRYVGSGLEGALADDVNCLMFPVGDVKSAAEQLGRLATNDALRLRIVAASQKLVATRYSVELSVEGWARALDRVAELPALAAVATASTPLPAGRLDRMLGVSAGETIRRVLGVRYRHASAGGEWPHTSFTGKVDEAAALRRAGELDR